MDETNQPDDTDRVENATGNADAAVTLADGVQWLNECYPHGERHEHVSVYLIRSEQASILVDSGSFYHRDPIEDRIARSTDGDGLDAIVLSHSDYPHAGNVSEFRGKWDDVELVASSGSPELQGLSDARRCRIGESLTVADRRFSFIDPPLADRSHTTWIYDHGSGVLFTADGFGNYHLPSQCDATSHDFADGIPLEAIYEFHAKNLVWLRYVDPDKLRAALTDIFDEYDVSYVAPIHGNPIAGSEIDEYLDKLVDAAARIASEYSVPES
jgi:flavorubredoxin